jgi:hypothetical protein
MTTTGIAQGNAYFVTNSVWSRLANPIKTGVEKGFNAAYFIRGKQYLTFRKVSPSQIPTRLNFVDVIIRLESGPEESLRLFNSRVWRQLSVVLRTLSRSPTSYPTYFIPNAITATKLDVGVAVALKSADFLPHICISEGVISLESAWTTWKFMKSGGLKGKAEPPGPVGSKLNSKEQKSFGISLGRCVAHEAWHQIIYTPWGRPPYGNRHPCPKNNPGIECDETGSDWWKDKASFGSHGKYVVQNTIPRLIRLQGKEKTLDLFRG